MAKDLIFVQIAAFRDPEYQRTLGSMFSRASNPENITVGACLQYDWEADKHCFQYGTPRPSQIKEIRIDAKDSQGVCWARHETQKLYDGEKFSLLIDSHMRFDHGWDQRLIGMWRSLRKTKSVLTHYPPNYEPRGGRERRFFEGLGASDWREGTLWFHRAQRYSVDNPPAKPLPGAFIAAGMLFGPGRVVTDVPYDPYLERHGEESTLAARLWTSGYDICHPNDILLWHRSSRRGRPMDNKVIDSYQDRVQLSIKRTRALLADEYLDDDEVTKDLDLYALGSARSLAAYERWAGVDFKNQVITEEARKGVFGVTNELAD